MVLPDGRVVTGKTGNAARRGVGAAHERAQGRGSGVDDELYVISDDVLEPICHLKTDHLQQPQPAPALRRDAAGAVHLLGAQPAGRRGSSTTPTSCAAATPTSRSIISAADEKLYRTLGINVCCEPKYEQHRYYHK